MKKTYKKLMVFAGAMGLAFGASAQLSGTVTINSANATGGTNYANFTAFAAAINTAGVNGPLTVNVSNGPYVEQIQFNQIAGASLVNRITINGNNQLITFNSSNSAAYHTIAMNGADYFTFNNLNVEAQGLTYGFATVLWNNADYNTYNNCTFSVNITATGTGVIPFVISGSGTTYASSAPSANFTSINSCTTVGGYNGVSIYGNATGVTASANNFADGNKVIGCNIRDFYYSGIWSYAYTKNTILRNNTIECPNRTNTTTKSGIYSYYNQGLLCEGNFIRNLFNSSLQTSTGTSYGIYCSYNLDSYTYGYSLPSRYPNIVRNNIISDINFNGTLYGIYFYYSDGQVYNNTISLDFAGSTAGTTYGIYTYGTTQYLSDCSNNMITIGRGGSGTKYGYYNVAGANAGCTGEKNNIFVNAPAGTNYVGYYSTTALTQAALASQGFNVNGTSLAPAYNNSVALDYMPTNAALDNLAQPKGLLFDQRNAVRNGTTPDIGAIEFLTPNCTGAPSIGAISGPTYALCPGENAAMIISNLVANQGINYTWQYSSVSNVGPFTTTVSAASPTNIAYTANNVTAPGWYQVVATCTNPGGGSSSPVIPIQIAGPTSNTIPYYEDFEGIGLPNRLPNCSWMASGLGTQNKTYTSAQPGNRIARSGVSFATFDAASIGTSAYYTNPIVMNTGITYSAAVYWATEYFGYNNWTNISILVGPNQSTTGLVQVASISPAISGPYKLLSGLFTVPANGNYYVCIRATSTSGSAQYLSIDDISVTIPCYAGGPNNPNLSASATPATGCAGDLISLTAAGATGNYTWMPINQNGPSVSDTPGAGVTTYTVMGDDALSGCVSTSTVQVNLNPAPSVFAVANPPVVCAGQPAVLSAISQGASFSWNNGQTTQNITVNPTTASSYTVMATGPNGCQASYAVQVGVNANPVISAVSSNADACKDDQLTLTAQGGVTYQWISSASSNVYQGNPINITSAASAVFTVTGVGANGCSAKYTLTQNISECTGIKSAGILSGVQVYPNPTSGALTVSFGNNADHSVVVTDVTGRVITTSAGNTSEVNVDLSSFAAGVYYVKLQSESASTVVKVVKQ